MRTSQLHKLIQIFRIAKQELNPKYNNRKVQLKSKFLHQRCLGRHLQLMMHQLFLQGLLSVIRETNKNLEVLHNLMRTFNFWNRQFMNQTRNLLSVGCQGRKDQVQTKSQHLIVRANEMNLSSWRRHLELKCNITNSQKRQETSERSQSIVKTYLSIRTVASRPLKKRRRLLRKSNQSIKENSKYYQLKNWIHNRS